MFPDGVCWVLMTAAFLGHARKKRSYAFPATGILWATARSSWAANRDLKGALRSPNAMSQYGVCGGMQSPWRSGFASPVSYIDAVSIGLLGT
ncbi:hypothetical protein K503DRAFT_771851 [Rhizopogon vinicolor AM-OR11-026]|uniref:Uncharacterized protein n=1 Tax=Rhizopogon vinicolor AM-OR11-026 TaxID=1314800 RepID=A0A1B7MWU3_9AGAM|nr:hypothetical protein K503DRAFT_771851 [Rhizopogon vinicolor AM-OR11-026]